MHVNIHHIWFIDLSAHSCNCMISNLQAFLVQTVWPSKPKVSLLNIPNFIDGFCSFIDMHMQKGQHSRLDLATDVLKCLRSHEVHEMLRSLQLGVAIITTL